MTSGLRDGLLEALETKYFTGLRPPTLQEIGDKFGVTNAAVYVAMQEHVADGTVIKLPGARGYMPAWVVTTLAEEGLKRITDPVARDAIQRMVNRPVKARLVDCMRFQFGTVEFPNPSTLEMRMNIALDFIKGLTLVGIQPTETGYDIIVHPPVCDCSSTETARKCQQCNQWICQDCERNHVCPF